MHLKPLFALALSLAPARSVLPLVLLVCQGGVLVLEQPSGSWMLQHPRMRWLWTLIRCMSVCMDVRTKLQHLWMQPSATNVFKTSWWMYHYGSKSPKRSVALSNSKSIRFLDRGRLKGWKQIKAQLGSKGVTKARLYVDSNGKRRWDGTKQLRSTEYLSLT